MKIERTLIPGVLVIRPRVFADARGFFLEAFNEARFARHGLPTQFRQDNHSRSGQDVLRGLHYQLRHPQGKLVTVVHGRIFDVAVDIRRGSPTFGRWHGIELSGEEPCYLWIPPGCAHGFCVLSDVADVVYKCTEVYQPEDERGIAWDDPALDITWPVQRPLISEKDLQYSPFDTTRVDLPEFAPATL